MRDKDTFDQFKLKDAKRKRLLRKTMSEEQRKKYNESCKIRMRKYRERNKHKQAKRLTRSERIKLREDWRTYKGRYREKLSHEKKKQNKCIKERKICKSKEETELFPEC